MIRAFRGFAVVVCLAACSAVFASGEFAGAGLAVSDESAPPGGMTQMKISLTEPKPISTGGGSLSFSAFDSVSGIALSPLSGDARGVALVRGTVINLSIVSPSATLGVADSDYPIVTLVGHVPATAPFGAWYPMTLDPTSLRLFDASGALYPTEVKQGSLVVSDGVAIGDVNPGSAILPAGAVVTLTGSNFNRDTRIRFGEAKIDKTRYVSPTRIDITLGAPANMHGMYIRASNPDDSEAEYYSYQRTFAALRSTDPVLQYAVPLVSPPSSASAVVAFPAPAANVTNGIALQNIGALDATATLTLLDETGSTIATTLVTVPSNRYVVQSLTELFGVAPAGASSVIVTSPIAPLEVLGIAADETTGTAMPVIAQ